jgi:hypothetical protein
MADPSSPIEFEDIPLDEARRMSRGPRMDPERYRALKENIQFLSQTTIRTTIPEGTNPTTMKNCIHRRAAKLGMPVTVRTIPGGLLFWRSTAEDLHQVQQVVARLQSARQPPQATQRSRRRHA